MPKYAKNPDELNKLLEKELKRIVQQEITPLIEKKLYSAIQVNVYDAYKSSAINKYQRTDTLLNSASHDLIKDGAIVYMEAYSDDIYDVIESGQGYTWEHSAIYETQQARPFFSKLVEEINSGELTDEVTMLLDKSFK